MDFLGNISINDALGVDWLEKERNRGEGIKTFWRNRLWIGWESSLRKYREWIHKKNRKQVTDPGTGKSQADSMMFYQPIYYFHVFMGVITTALLLLQCGILSRFFSGEIVTTDKYWIIINIVALTIFLIAVTPYNPSKVRYQIERKLAIWIEVFELNEKGTKISKDSHDR